MPANGGVYRYLADAARARPDHLAVVDPTAGHEVTYAQLMGTTGTLARRLVELGVRPGDRVGLCLPKSIESVATVYAVLRAGAAYVPVDPTAPASRNAFIFNDCAVRAIVVAKRLAAELKAAWPGDTMPALIVLDFDAERPPHAAWLEPAPDSLKPVPRRPEDLAFILYTSGSTGTPKGVMLSHENAVSYVDWCARAMQVGPDDRFSSHAPFHFDLSVLDLFLTAKVAGTVFLIGEELGKNPAGMVSLISDRKLTVWYSTPSVLTLLMTYGGLADHADNDLRLVLFAGEVFPVKHLRELTKMLPGRRFLNLYGPTETNVCTWHEVAAPVPDDRTEPYPIGIVCPHYRARVVDEDGNDVATGDEGELVIGGSAVMLGYWNLPERTAAAFFDSKEERWYRTGDVVVEGADGVFTYRGRRDRMVKRRGYRVELGEIEAALYRNPEIAEAAAVALRDEEGVTIRAVYASTTGKPLSLIQLKRFCADHLPSYMVPDRFSHTASLPRTSTDKVDYQALMALD